MFLQLLKNLKRKSQYRLNVIKSTGFISTLIIKVKFKSQELELTLGWRSWPLYNDSCKALLLILIVKKFESLF